VIPFYRGIECARCENVLVIARSKIIGMDHRMSQRDTLLTDRSDRFSRMDRAQYFNFLLVFLLFRLSDILILIIVRKWDFSENL